MPSRAKLVTADNWKAAYTDIIVHTKSNLSTVEIGARLRLSVTTINNVRASDEFKKRYRAYEAKVLNKTAETHAKKTVLEKARLELERSAAAAARLIRKLMKEGTSKDRLRFEAAKEILHIAGLKPVDVVETRERAYAPEEIESAKKTLLEVMTLLERITDPEEGFLLRSMKAKTLEVLPDSTPVETRSSATDESSNDIPLPDVP